MYKRKTAPLYLANYESVINLINSLVAVTKKWIENMDISKHQAQEPQFT